jgi:hypothetical protein
MDLETLVSSYFNDLTRLVAREDFIIHSRRESSRSYTGFLCLHNCRPYRHFLCKTLTYVNKDWVTTETDTFSLHFILT